MTTFPFAPLRPFDVAQGMLCGRYSETDRCAKRTLRKPSCPESVVSNVEPCLRGENWLCFFGRGFAALCLCGEYLFTGNPEEAFI